VFNLTAGGLLVIASILFATAYALTWGIEYALWRVRVMDRKRQLRAALLAQLESGPVDFSGASDYVKKALEEIKAAEPVPGKEGWWRLKGKP
jgi:hypothetical protein